MNQKWFTIMFRQPSAQVKVKNAKQNCTGDFIAFDGFSTYFEVIDSAAKLAKACKEVDVFLGKEVGKLIASYRNGIFSE